MINSQLYCSNIYYIRRVLSYISTLLFPGAPDLHSPLWHLPLSMSSTVPVVVLRCIISISDTPRKAVCVSALVLLVLLDCRWLSWEDCGRLVLTVAIVVVLALLLVLATSPSSQSIGDSWSLKCVCLFKKINSSIYLNSSKIPLILLILSTY